MCPAELVKPLRLPLRSYESSRKLEHSDIIELHTIILQSLILLESVLVIQGRFSLIMFARVPVMVSKGDVDPTVDWREVSPRQHSL